MMTLFSANERVFIPGVGEVTVKGVLNGASGKASPTAHFLPPARSRRVAVKRGKNRAAKPAPATRKALLPETDEET